MRLRTLRWILAAAAPPIMALVLAAPALALGEPSGEFAVFKECPFTNPMAIGCVYDQTASGEVTIGNSSVPITKTITLQAGVTAAGPMLPAVNGETLSHSPQPVPGGLAGLIKCNEIHEAVAKLACQLVFENGLTGVNATTELVGTPEWFAANLFGKSGVGLVLPVRVHLENPLLGSACYIGSASEPITLKLTTGTTSPPPPNEPISGSTGTAEIKEGGQLVIARNSSVVDNSFAAPGVNGCGGLLSVVLDPVIDAKLALPSAAGKNTAILTGTLEEAAVEAVYRSAESAKEKEEREAKEKQEATEREEQEKREREERKQKEREEEEREEQEAA